ncbi:MAG: thiamine diphosphokinase, partial [Acidimicrobiia bacterium]|nr:thiamine diphosphokinase [Acidimicrobiia bacterium]
FAGGSATSPPPASDGVFVVAADAGYDHAVAAGWSVDLLVGDLDSISPDGLSHAERNGVDIQRHPQDKDETDLELALDAVTTSGATEVDIFGALGGSPGHFLGAAALITADRYRRCTVRWHFETAVAHVVQPERPLTTAPRIGARLSIVAVTDAEGVTTTGVRWPLDDASLARGTSRGLSNVTTSSRVTVQIARGVLMTIIEREPT